MHELAGPPSRHLALQHALEKVWGVDNTPRPAHDLVSRYICVSLLFRQEALPKRQRRGEPLGQDPLQV